MSTQTAGLVPEFTTPDRLRKAREFAGLEQGELADLMGVSRNTVSNNEKGKVRPRRIVVRAWAMATGVDAGWLETGTAPQPEPEGGEECTIRDSNPEPTDLRRPAGHHRLADVVTFPAAGAEPAA